MQRASKRLTKIRKGQSVTAALAPVRQTEGLQKMLLLRRERPGGASPCSPSSSFSPQGPTLHRPGPVSLLLAAGELCVNPGMRPQPPGTHGARVPLGEGLTATRLSWGLWSRCPTAGLSRKWAPAPDPKVPLAPASAGRCGKLSRQDHFKSTASHFLT